MASVQVRHYMMSRWVTQVRRIWRLDDKTPEDEAAFKILARAERQIFGNSASEEAYIKKMQQMSGLLQDSEIRLGKGYGLMPIWQVFYSDPANMRERRLLALADARASNQFKSFHKKDILAIRNACVVDERVAFNSAASEEEYEANMERLFAAEGVEMAK